MMKRLLICLTLLLIALSIVPTLAQDDDADRAVEIVAKTPEFYAWLEQYPGSFGQASDDDGDGIWYVEFYAEDWNEWLGYADVNLATGEIVESFIPLPLTAEEFQRGQDRIVPLVQQDAEISAMLGDPILWNMYVDFNRYDRVWEVNFYRGIQALQVIVTLNEDEDYFSIEEIRDPNALEADEQREAWRDEAINLAYSGDGAGEAIDGYDDWTTYAENLRPGVWSVAFVAGGQELYFAVVDVNNDTVIETRTP
jgi:hypothetical protein